MNAASLLDQSVLDNNSVSLGTTKNSSFSVRDILELPSSQNSYSTANLSLRNNYRSVSTGTEQMIAHDLYPQNSLRHLPLSAGSYNQQEERQFQERFSYSPQYVESRSSSATEPSFSYVQDNQSYGQQGENQPQRPVLTSSLSVHHGISVGSNCHLSSAVEKRVHSVDSLPEMSASPSNIQSNNCSSSFSSAMLGKSIESMQARGEKVKNENFVNNLHEDSHFPTSVDFSAAKEKYQLSVDEQISTDFASSNIFRKSENDVFLPDESSTSDKQTTNWRKIDESVTDTKYKGNRVFFLL